MNDPHDALPEHPDLADTSAAMRAEWRAEQEAATRDAVEGWAQRQTIEDRLRAHMHRGDEIAITVAGHRVAGTPEEVGPDLVALRTPAGRVDVHQTATIPFWFEVAMRATEGGHRGSDAAGGRFRAALMMRGADARVTLGTRDHPDGIDGSLVVGADHVVLTRTGGLELVVPIVDVAWVRVAGD